MDAGAAGDGAPPGEVSCVSFATLLALDTCQLAFDSELVIQTRMTSKPAIYDTGLHTLTVDGASVPVAHTTVTLEGNEVEVISARAVTVASSTRFRAVGPLPLVIAVSGDIVVSVDAQIDVSDGGAGAQMSCVDGASPGASDSGGGGGGGGGGYGAEGGKGGDGDTDGGRSAGGAKGLVAAAMPASLRGGCPGAQGGAGEGAGGAGGAAGGALYLVAAGRIDLRNDSVVHAGGGPGLGGARGDAGGGGGGSGGMVLLEAPHIIGPDAVIAANGGGGGGGADTGAAGEPGAAGTLTEARASGGRGTSSIFTATGSGIDGGRGGSRPEPAGEDVTAADLGGGGGGGGGVGVIRIASADPELGALSPDPR